MTTNSLLMTVTCDETNTPAVTKKKRPSKNHDHRSQKRQRRCDDDEDRVLVPIVDDVFSSSMITTTSFDRITKASFSLIKHLLVTLSETTTIDDINAASERELSDRLYTLAAAQK